MVIVVGLPLHFIFWYLTMVNIATPSFIGKPENRVALVDARQVRLPTLETVLMPKITEFLSGIGVSIKNAQTMATNIGKDLLSGKLNIDQAEDRLKDALGVGRLDYEKIKDYIKPLILQELTGYNTSTGTRTNSDNYKDQFEVNTPDQAVETSNLNFKYVKAVLNIAKDTVGNDLKMDVVDTGAKTAALVGVVNGLGGLGATQFVPEVISKLDRNMAFNIVKGSSTTLIDSGNLNTLNELKTITPLNTLTINTPDAARRLLKNYVIPDGVTPDNYNEEAAKFKSILNDLKPDWLLTVRDGKTVYNLNALKDASEGAVEVLSRDYEVNSSILTATHYDVVPLKELLKKNYPLIAIGNQDTLNTVKPSITLTDRTLNKVNQITNSQLKTNTKVPTQYKPLP